MRKRANLLLQKKDYLKREKFFYYFRCITIGFGVISIIILISIIYLTVNVKMESDSLDIKISDKQKFINNNIELKTGINYFNQKNNLVSDILKKDVNFLPYYNKLYEFIPLSTDEAIINNINFNNKREVDFTVSFTSFEYFKDFLGALQAKTFLDIFDALTLQSFSIKEGTMTNYTLQLVGVLKPLETSLSTK